MGLLGGVFIGLLTGLTDLHQEGSHTKRQVRRLSQVVDGLIIGTCGALGFGIVDGLLVGFDQGIIDLSRYGLLMLIVVAISFGTGKGTKLLQAGSEITPAETIAWSWENVWRKFPESLKNGSLVGLSIALIIFLTFGLASGIFYGWVYGWAFGLVYAPIVGLAVAVTSILTSVLNNGWSSDMLDEHHLMKPNEGIRRSARNSLLTIYIFGPVGGISSGLASGLAFGLLGQLSGWPILGTGFAIVFGITFALTFGVTRGGTAWIEHYVLRIFLWRAGCLSWNCIHFLDYAVERIFLRKVGGGYSFEHRLLLEYFASLDTGEVH